MQSVIGTLVYKITGDSAALDRSLDLSGKKIEATGKKLSQLGTIARKVGSAVFTGALVKSMLDTASRAEELGNKFDTVFAGMEIASDRWARKYAEDTSRGVIATKEFLATQQDLQTGYGDTVEHAAAFSKAVVGVTNDLASFSNISVEETMEAMNSGLSGQFEALRRLGVGLNVNIINQGKYAQSINKTWEEMDNLERREAILSGIMSQSKNALHQEVEVWQDYDYAIGDAAKTSDSYANSSQGLRQRLDDLKAEMGEMLLPIANDVVHIALSAVDAFNDWDDSSQRLVVALGAVAAAVLTIGGPVGAAVGAISAFIIAVDGVKTPVENLQASCKDLNLEIDEYRRLTEEAEKNTENLTKREQELYDLRQKVARNNALQTVLELMDSYDRASRQAAYSRKKMLEAEKEAEAWELKAAEGAEAVKIRRNKLEQKAARLSAQGLKLSEEEQAELKALNFVAASWGVTQEKSLGRAEKARKRYQDESENLTEKEDALSQSINTVAMAMATGLITEENLSDLDEELIGQIKEKADALKAEQTAREGASAEAKKQEEDEKKAADKRKKNTEAILDRIREQGYAEKETAAQKLESEGKISEAYELRGEILDDQHAHEKKLLQEKIDLNEASAEDMASLDLFYANEHKALSLEQAEAEKKASEEKQRSIDEWIRKTAALDASEKEASASKLESEGKIAEAYAIRQTIIDDEEKRAVASYEKKLAEGKVSEEELTTITQHFAEKRKALAADEARAVEASEKSREDFSEQMQKRLQSEIHATQEATAAEAEKTGDFETAYAIRMQILDEELASEKKALQKKIDLGQATNADLVTLEESYAQKVIGLTEKRKVAEKNWAEQRKAQSDSLEKAYREEANKAREATAAELEKLGKIDTAYAIRRTILEEEQAFEIAAMEERVAKGKATEEDLDTLRAKHAEQRKKLASDEERAEKDLQETRKKNAEAVEKALVSQQNASRTAQAAELERRGKIKEALALQLKNLKEEENAEIKAMREKIKRGEATEKEILKIQEKYRLKREDAEKDAAEKAKQRAEEFASAVWSQVMYLGDNIVALYSAVTDRAIAEIDRDTDAQLEALCLKEESKRESLQREYDEAVKAGDMETAKEKARELERNRIEEEAENRKKKLQREQAEREKQLALFKAHMDMLAAIVGFLADPGGWSGLALSGMAGINGALQIEAIKQQPLPSFDVGAERIPKDMLAVVHEGETVLPKPMAESIRQGDAVYGGNNGLSLVVNIENHTDADVDVSAEGDGKERELRILIGKVVESQIDSGRYDRMMNKQYGLRSIGKNG